MTHAQPAPAPDPAPTVAAVVVLAAGQGTRMRSATPKVLHTLGGRSLVGHVLAAAEPLAAGTTVVVVGSGRDQVEEHLAQIAPSALPVVQEEQLGSGHAAAVALAAVPDLEGSVLVVNGDSPLLTSRTLAALVAAHDAAGSVFTVLTAEVDDPTGLGRIVRDGSGAPRAIVEERDATVEQRAIREVNAGVYVANAGTLRRVLSGLATDNAQGEQYLTDALAPLVAGGAPTAAVRADDPDDVLGCNDRVELAARRRTLNDRVLDALMRSGVTVVDPLTTWVDVTATVGRDAVLEPGTHLRGVTVVGDGAHVGPDTTLADTHVGDLATVLRTHAVGARIGPDASVGPFAYLRPGTDLGMGAKVGTFVETKNAQVGEGSKIPHLSYVGDATIGRGTNIGAATVFVNYDGVAKHHTTIGDHARTGADNMFVAPVTVGDGAYTAAGSVITSDVPPGAMAVARAPQRNVAGWVRRRRSGTPAADAAAAAESRSEAPREDPSGPSRADHDS
ncbi:bifunctional UDP-N-acetylglucosamine diphosphorylase/glucosamine-1-phosphate N-acetyltransferase GlmU [Blastococcus saxobsidens]|uniref:Bifunctional protein GlmU n=1 Tax=Blastococcus saxobsidens TaxID=138336 RepID=A0A4Q7YBJ9_9ACTN|nr:bifunctional UDP-N-acetylglucosamine diphosphorylase/glucosamine-1-phosphate N-acetyltransferase GlmU [Blastococcus saxobsidens]RZU34440.1 UDP-N-acetylglucosamine pyrophosphorylase /glucosamine-1-phosphate N-acetyltransferase [Blastococcus saxobsidens]